jgi:hypothetical protein
MGNYFIIALSFGVIGVLWLTVAVIAILDIVNNFRNRKSEPISFDMTEQQMEDYMRDRRKRQGPTLRIVTRCDKEGNC